MNELFFDLLARRFIVGNWDSLSGEQQRIFVTYVKFNYSSDIGNEDPAQFARKLWNDSVDAANSQELGANARLLDQSKLTTYIGVTSLWEKRDVSTQVTLVTHINGDQAHNNFRLYGELSPDGGEVVKKAFSHKIAGSEHGEYSVSRREQGVWGQPNGQFSLTEDLLRFDSDVDYRRLLSPGHNTKENSDIRATEGSTSHLSRHIKRYGLIPITMRMPAFPVEFSEEESQRAFEVAVQFIEKFESELTLDSIYKEMFAPNAIHSISDTGFFESIGLSPALTASLDSAVLQDVFVAFMDFYYLHALWELNTKIVQTGDKVNTLKYSTDEADRVLRSSNYLRILTVDSGVESFLIGNAIALSEYISDLKRLSNLFRDDLLREGICSELYRVNVRRINEQKSRHYRTERAPSDKGEAEEILHIVEHGIYIIIMTRRVGAFMITSLGMGN